MYEATVFLLWLHYARIFRSYLRVILPYRLQLASLMYERGTGPLNSALAEAGRADNSSPSNTGNSAKNPMFPSLSEHLNGSLLNHTPASNPAPDGVSDKLHEGNTVCILLVIHSFKERS